ncbi:MAG: hypothetical protein KTR22_02425 [Flavobacteriaceae bacterium]|nr:hypothetical protein [Flavobacteriaceae bacterium]
MKNICILIALLISGSSFAQEKDFSDIDTVMTTLYAVISGPGEQERDWKTFYDLFHEQALMGPTRKNKEGVTKFNAITPYRYVELSAPQMRNTGFFEEELARKTEVFGGIAQIFSAYQFRFKPDGPVIQRGVNSIQLVFRNGRWFITQIFWQDETEEFPLPEWAEK